MKFWAKISNSNGDTHFQHDIKELISLKQTSKEKVLHEETKYRLVVHNIGQKVPLRSSSPMVATNWWLNAGT